MRLARTRLSKPDGANPSGPSVRTGFPRMNEWEQPVTMQENRRKRQPHDFIWLVASLLVLVFGYLLFRQIYDASESLPFAQETILVFLGAVATIFLTAVLLNRQTELELSKEGRVLLFDQKNAVYMAAVEKIAEIVEEQRHDPQLIDELRVIGHKLAIVGSAPVIGAFRTVLDLLLGGLRDGELDNKDDAGPQPTAKHGETTRHQPGSQRVAGGANISAAAICHAVGAGAARLDSRIRTISPAQGRSLYGMDVER